MTSRFLAWAKGGKVWPVTEMGRLREKMFTGDSQKLSIDYVMFAILLEIQWMSSKQFDLWVEFRSTGQGGR